MADVFLWSCAFNRVFKVFLVELIFCQVKYSYIQHIHCIRCIPRLTVFASRAVRSQSSTIPLEWTIYWRVFLHPHLIASEVSRLLPERILFTYALHLRRQSWQTKSVISVYWISNTIGIVQPVLLKCSGASILEYHYCASYHGSWQYCKAVCYPAA